MLARELTIKVDVDDTTAKRTLAEVDARVCKPGWLGVRTEDEVLRTIAKLAESMEQVDFEPKA